MGTGVLGPVYRASESDGDRTVAIKSFELDLTPEQVEVFGNALADIVNVEVSHPAIVAPLAAGLEAGTPFMAYEYIEAESLDVALRREARPAAALEWIAALAGAVDAAHARGLVHGALHLRDVLVSADGVCATGFGIGSALELVRLGIPVRRPYAAPEVAAGRRWGPPADRFAVAVLAYELLTGTRPAGNGDQVLGDLRELCPSAADPAGLQQAFRNVLADEPAIRSASATAFVTAVARAMGDETPASPAAVAGGPPGAGLDETGGAQPGARSGAGVAEGGDAPFGAPGSDPPEQAALPDEALSPENPVPKDAEADYGGQEVRGERMRRPQRASGPKRRPPRRAGARRRTGPVVAVRDDVHFDPLDAGAAVASRDDRIGSDDDVPPPPSPTSMRAMAPVMVAMAVGVLVAYLVFTGLWTAGDEAPGPAPDAAEVPVTAVEPRAEARAGAGPRDTTPAAGGPRVLVEEPVVPVGDPPLRGGADPLAGAGERVVDTPAADAAPPAFEPPSADVDAPVAAPRPSTAVAPPAPEAAPAASLAAAGVPEPDAPADAAGSLLVRSRPPGATVRVDDVVVGVTPVEVPGVASGARRVRIELPGYRLWATEVDVSGTEQVRVGASLLPEDGR